MSMTRREALAAAVAGGLATTAGAAPAADQPLTPNQAGSCVNGETVTVRFQVARDFSAGGEGDLWLLNYLSSDPQTGASRVAFRAVLSGRCRREFGRVGVADLAAHFAGRVVTVRGTVASAVYLGPRIHRVVLTIDSLEQFVSVV